MLMKNIVKLALVAMAAGALTVGFACDKDGAAATAEKAGGCNHGKAEAASAKGGCQHDAAKVERASYKDEAGGCPFHSKATDSQKAALAKGEKVTLVGQVVCANCDLHQAQECKSLFKTADGKTFAIVGNDAFEKLAAETKHGEKKVEILGTSAKDADESILLLESYKIVG
jgi:hypothetical protein